MPSSPVIVEFNYLHTCDNGPINGRIITLMGLNGATDYLNFAEIFVLDRPQPTDHSELHGENNLAHVLVCRTYML